MNILDNVKKLLSERATHQKRIDEIDKLLAPLGGNSASRSKAGKGKPKGKGKRKGPSAAAKKRMAAAAKERWKKAKAAGKSHL